jgi:hypothetical protein
MKLTLVEWNVQDFFLLLAYPVSSKDIEGLSDEQWSQLAEPDTLLKPLSKIREIAEIIRELDADIVFLCEVGGLSSLETFNRLFLDDSYRPLLRKGNSQRGIESGFLVRRSLPFESRVKSHRDWPVPFHYPYEEDPLRFKRAAEAAAYYDLGKAEERRFSRDVPALLLKKDGKTRAVFLLVHLKSGLDPVGVDEEGRVRRAAEVKALLHLRDALAVKVGSEVPIFLTGDFNGRAHREGYSPEFTPIYRRYAYQDALEIKAVPTYERITQMTFIRREIHASQLDYFFVPAAFQDQVSEAFVYRYRDESREKMLPLSFRDRRLLPSDHYPLVVRLEIDL